MNRSRASVTVQEAEAAPPPRLLVDVPSAALALSLGQTAVWMMVREGRLRSVRVGRRRLITWASLEEYVKSLEANAA